MCGVAGFIDLSGASPAERSARLKAMTDAVRHRGPDGEGHWVEGPLALGHRRLAILDLSPTGHQPMESASGRHVISYNGEIYNHGELRSELSASSPRWRGTSDTEALLAAIEAWGVEEALRHCIGMFAFALWDRREQRLTLARDRFGEKPLYFGWQGGVFLFGSELKALRAHPSFAARIDRQAVADLVHWGYVAAPASIFDGIEKLRAGELAELDLRSGGARAVRRRRYWRVEDEVAHGVAQPFRGTLDEAADALQERLDEAVRLQRHADVPVGAFLSGGVDSSLVVARMQRQSTEPLHTFSIGFTEAQFDESAHARLVAAHIGTDHHELIVSPADAMAVIPRLPTMFDEPLGDASQIPTHLVASLARQQVTVSVSGDGGDELFGGYVKYRTGSHLAAFPLRRGVGALVCGPLGQGAARLAQHIPGIGALLRPERVQRVGRLLADSGAAIAEDLGALIPAHGNPVDATTARSLWPSPPPAALERQPYGITAALLDTLGYLPDDVLVKVDRASMAVSLESRAPLLDHRVAQLAFSLPWSMRGARGNDKRVLRALLYRCVPQALVNRSKMGFSLPINRWLREDLREWAASLILSPDAGTDGLFNREILTSIWRSHIEGRADRSGSLWPILMFLAWRQSL